MAVVGVLVEAVVGHEHERVADFVAEVAQRDLHDAVGRVGLRAVGVLCAGTPKRITPGMPSSASARTSLRRLSCVCCTTPGIDTTGSGASMPSFTNSGATRSSTASAVLGDQPAQRRRPPQPAEPAFGERHGRTALPATTGRAQLQTTRGDEAVDRVRIGFDVDAQAALARGRRDVTGPIETTGGCGSGSGPTTSQKFVTVDDDVNVIASTSPRAHTRERIAASGAAVTVRYTGSTSTV